MIYTFSALGKNGRLANSLFQIAATIGVAIKNNTTAVFPSWVCAETGRDFSRFFKTPLDQSLNVNALTHKIHESHFHYAPIDLAEAIQFRYNDEQICDLEGYYQSEKYFAHCKDVILKQFEFSDEVQQRCEGIMARLKTALLNHTFISVHLRFGDYVGNNYYAQLTETDYYQKAFEYCEKKFVYGTKKILYLVFSDDKERAATFMKQFEKQINHTTIAGTDDIDDLCLQTLCANNIMANSSFSWWSGFLNKNEHKIVISPKQWFNPEVCPHDTKDLYTSEMVVL